MQRASFLTDKTDAHADVRKTCNGLKRMSSLCATAVVRNIDTALAAATAEKMAFDILSRIGFDVSNDARVDGVLPMMVEATSLVLADAAYHAEGAGPVGAAAFQAAAQRGVEVMTAVAKSKAVHRLSESVYPTDIEGALALRLTVATAMASVAVEVNDNDYSHPAEECVKEASKVVLKAAADASSVLSPGAASPATRVMLTQSLVTAAAKVYAACWKVETGHLREDLAPLSAEQHNARLDQMQRTPLASLLQPVNQRFAALFSAVCASARDEVGLLCAAAKQPAPATPVKPAGGAIGARPSPKPR